MNSNIAASNELIRLDRASLGEARVINTPDPGTTQGQDFVSLATYWHVLQKRRWTVLGVAVVLTTLVAIGSFAMRPIYRGISRVQVEAETPLIQSLEDLYQQ